LKASDKINIFLHNLKSANIENYEEKLDKLGDYEKIIFSL
jgi:hypothetical protein